jgi:hypothetical protein
MGNLLSLYPKIHCLDADTQIYSGVANCQREFLTSKDCYGAGMLGVDLGEVLWIHASLYGIRGVQDKSLQGVLGKQRF